MPALVHPDHKSLSAMILGPTRRAGMIPLTFLPLYPAGRNIVFPPCAVPQCSQLQTILSVLNLTSIIDFLIAVGTYFDFLWPAQSPLRHSDIPAAGQLASSEMAQHVRSTEVPPRIIGEDKRQFLSSFESRACY